MQALYHWLDTNIAFLFGLLVGIPAGWLLLGIVTMPRVKWPTKSNESQARLAGRK